jgi:hypothetical protein
MKKKQQSALMTLDELIATYLPKLVKPMPSRRTVERWFKAAQVPFFKANPKAPHGGGTRFFSVAAVDRVFRSRAVSFRRRAKAPTAKSAT